MAVIKQSESDLLRALLMSPQDINSTNKFGQTALHLSIDWPLGMHILLDAGADTECVDHASRVPLQYAIERMLVDPIRLLGEANCLFRQEERISVYGSSNKQMEEGSNTEPVDHQWSFLVSEVTDFNSKWRPSAVLVLATLLDLIISRRKRLLDLAKRTLPFSEMARWCPYGSDGTHVIDEKASGLAFELKSRGIQVPAHLDPGKDQTTCYHCFAGYPELAERLWKAGFRDVNGKDSLGRTPLMLCARNFSHNWLEFVTWILGKGADLYARQDVGSVKGQHATYYPQSWQLLRATTIFFVSWELGKPAPIQLQWRGRTEFFDWNILTGNTPQTLPTLRRIVMDCTTDDCTCSCSVSGCTARTLIGRSYTSREEKKDLYKRTYDYREIILNLAELIDVDSTLGSCEVLRLLTFQELGLTHVCCRPRLVGHIKSSYMFFRIEDQAEINEIREEESAGLLLLEELLTEFELKMDELGIPFPDFLTDYWAPRMEQVLDENLDQDLEIDTAPQGLASGEEGDNSLPNAEIESDHINGP